MKTFIPFLFVAVTSALGFGQIPKKSETVKVNGINMYYEVHGDGEPLLLLHGWTQSSEFWSEYIPTYIQHFKVYTIDLRGHGKTSPISSAFTIEESANDILELLDYLKIDKVRAIGLSYGGLTLLEMASSNPEKIQSMILIGASHSYNGAENYHGDISFLYENLPTSFIEDLKKIHHQGEAQIKALFDPNLDYQIEISMEELNAFNFRTLIVNGDRDEILGLDPAFSLYKNIPNSELWIVPDTGHIAIIGTNQKSFLKKSVQFLSSDNSKNQIPINN